jgi:putrescine aminotransferase
VRPLINMCVFSPPLTITTEQIDEMFDIIEESLLEVSKEML